MGVYGAFELTFGRERVDFLTVNRKGIWRAYEVKVTKEDFHSKAAKTFVGHYNYFVMPEDLYEEVKKDIPKHIGVHNGSWVISNPRKQELNIDEQILKDSLIRSLYREQEKFIQTCDSNYINRLNREINRLRNKTRINKENFVAELSEWIETCTATFTDTRITLESIERTSPVYKNDAEQSGYELYACTMNLKYFFKKG